MAFKDSLVDGGTSWNAHLAEGGRAPVTITLGEAVARNYAARVNEAAEHMPFTGFTAPVVELTPEQQDERRSNHAWYKDYLARLASVVTGEKLAERHAALRSLAATGFRGMRDARLRMSAFKIGLTF